MKETLNYVFGDLTPGEWTGLFVLLSIGAIAQIAATIVKRSDQSTKPSFSYWIKQLKNQAKVVLTIILFWFVIRFYPEVVPFLKKHLGFAFDFTMALMMVIVGFSSQYLLHRILKLAPKPVVSRAGFVGGENPKEDDEEDGPPGA